MSVDARPTVDAPDDDPWLWLEEVEGERGLGLGRAQNARTLAAFGGPQVETDATTLAAIFDRPDKIPFLGRRGRWFYNFWTDAAHPRGLWRRTTPESFRSDAPDWDVLIDLDALAIGRGRGLDLGRRRRRARQRTTAPSCGCRAAAAMRSCCASSISPRSRSWPTASSCPRPRAARAGSTTTRCCCAAPSAATSPPRAMPARCGCGGAARSPRRRRSCSRCRPRACRRRAGSTAPIPSGRSGSTTRSASSTSRSGASKARLDLPTDVQTDIDHGWLAVQPRNAWTVGGRTWPGDCLLGIRLDAFLAGEPRLHAAVRARQAARPERLHGWNAGRLILSILDNLAAGVRGADARRPTAGRGRRWPACRRSAWSTSGRSMSNRRRPTATCWPARRIR